MPEIRGVLADVSLRRLAAGVLIPPFAGTDVPDWVLAELAGGLAGITLYGPNIASPARLAGLTRRLAAAAPSPVIAIDEEGGDVTRIAHQAGSPYPGNAALGAVDDPALTTAVYRGLGADLTALGINLDLAPSVDVNSAAGNPVIGTRSFGSDPDLVTRHAAAAVGGLQAAGLAACAKHFPGHGSTTLDTHHEIATVDVPMDLLARRDLPPFVAAIGAGVRAVMPGHLRVPGLTGDLPASLSAAALTGLLRGELGFTGVIISDALEMQAVSGPFGLPEAAVRAVAAGTDLLCLGRDQDRESYLAVRAALMSAVGDGRLPAARLADAAARVAELRAWLAVAQPGPAAGTAGPARIRDGARGTRTRDGASGGPGGSPVDGEHVGLIAARRAARYTGPPLPPGRPLAVQLLPPQNIAVGAVPWGLAPWLPEASIRSVPIGADAVALAAADLAAEDPEAAHAGGADPAMTGPGTANPGPANPGTSNPGTANLRAAVDAAIHAAAERPLIIVVREAHRYAAARAAVGRLLSARPDAVVVEMGLPVWRPPAARSYLATYGAARTSGQAAAEILGLSTPVSPVT
jgi:beta-N-acetylhexosaminidase